MPPQASKHVSVEVRESATVRLSGDAGDGMQLAGNQFAAHLGPGRQLRVHLARVPG